MQWLRSGIFFVGFVISVLICTTLVVLFLPLSYQTRYALVRHWSRFVLWWLRVSCKIDYQVEGRERLPQSPAIVLSKHQSAWETIAYNAILPRQSWVMKREILWLPIYGWAVACLRPIAIHRGKKRHAVQQILEKGERALQQGNWIVIYPEGTRALPGTHRRFAGGGALLAERSGYPVVPVAHNSGSHWPKSSFLMRPGTIQVCIGPAIDPHGKIAADINEQAESWVRETMQRLQPEQPPPISANT